MQRITCYLLLAVGALVAPIAGRAQVPRTQAPQPKVRQIATIPRVDVGAAERMPNGRVIIYNVGDSLMAYDLGTKRSTLITRDAPGNEFSISPTGDRIAWGHQTQLIWSMPLDAQTGTAAGPAQRVSLSQGDTPSLSPDGKLIAFARFTPNGNDLAVVPATGGAEQILAKYDRGIYTTSWSGDGKWIFVGFGWPTRALERVPAAGGPSERAISYSGAGEGSIDGRIAFYRPDARARTEGRIAYVTTSGGQGEFRIPPGTWTGSDPPGVWSAQSLLIHTTRPSAAHMLNLADGTVRDLLPGALNSRAPVWSPDGRRLALQTGTSEHFEITVMNADGSQLRRYPVSVDPTTTSMGNRVPPTGLGTHMSWSPSSQTLAYYAGAGATTLAVLDPATGRTHVVSSAPPDGAIQNFIWRPDGKSIVLIKQTMNDAVDIIQSERRLRRSEVYETLLDGTERKLRDIAAEFPDSRPGGFISDRLLVMGAPRWESAVISIAGGTAQKLPGTDHRLPSPGVSTDGKWVLWLIRNTDGGITSVQLMTNEGDSLRTMNLPFEVDRRFPYSAFLPDGQHVILVGKPPGEGTSKIFLVPLNGETPRVLTQVQGRLTGMFDISPDGKTLVYTVEGTPTSTIYELDVTPILQSIGKR